MRISAGLIASLLGAALTFSAPFAASAEGDKAWQACIGATVERISADQVDEAWDRAVAGDVRFRFVIDTSTITTGA